MNVLANLTISELTEASNQLQAYIAYRQQLQQTQELKATLQARERELKGWLAQLGGEDGS